MKLLITLTPDELDVDGKGLKAIITDWLANGEVLYLQADDNEIRISDIEEVE